MSICECRLFFEKSFSSGKFGTPEVILSLPVFVLCVCVYYLFFSTPIWAFLVSVNNKNEAKNSSPAYDDNNTPVDQLENQT